MEIYNFYNSVRMVLANLFSGVEAWETMPTLVFLFLSLLIGAGIWLSLFILQGIGLYKMAKSQGLKQKFLVFVPFASIYYVGKITGGCRFFNHKMKHAGTYALVAQLLAALCSFAMLAAEFYLYMVHGEPQWRDYIEGMYTYSIPYWPTATSGLGGLASWYFENGEMFIYLFGLIYDILMLVLVIALFKKYAPKNHIPFALLSIFVPVARYIVIFVLRNRQPVDYDQYMRAKREAYIRQQQQRYGQYGNPYGNPYNNPYSNPYGGQGQSRPNDSSKAPEDPFEEFSTPSNAGSSTQNTDTQSGGGEDFFS